MECDSCKRALSKNHPDIITITHEKPNSIGIEDIRIQLIDDVSIKPYTGPYKIYILNEAEKLTLQAQNAVKDDRGAAGLCGDPAFDQQCGCPASYDFFPVRDFEPASGERERSERISDGAYGLPDYQAQIDAAFAQGNIGKAKQIAESTEFAEMAERAFRCVNPEKEQ